MARKKKKPRKKKALGKSRPKKFTNYESCVRVVKKSVYIIVRGRKEVNGGKSGYRWHTLGTGFVAGHYRFVTAAHVINDPSGVNERQHQDGDLYYLLRHDDESNWHYQITPLNLD